MKRCILLFTVCTYCFVLHSAVAATNLLSIHLVADKVFPQWQPGTMPKPDSLRLISPPVLADADFVSFDSTNQTFTVTAVAAKRLATIPLPAPFVLKASGEPVYVGAIYGLGSSSSFAGPVILPDIGTNSFHIELGYPGAFPGMIDPRRDNRIVSAVQKLFSHEKQ
jgi:hypothetical protein